MTINFLLASVMTESIKQKYCIKFCQKLGNNQTETIQKIQKAFGDVVLSQTQIKKWFNRYRSSQMSVESEACSGRPFTCQNKEGIDKVHQIVIEDCHLTLKKNC